MSRRDVEAAARYLSFMEESFLAAQLWAFLDRSGIPLPDWQVEGRQVAGHRLVRLGMVPYVGDGDIAVGHCECGRGFSSKGGNQHDVLRSHADHARDKRSRATLLARLQEEAATSQEEEPIIFSRITSRQEYDDTTVEMERLADELHLTSQRVETLRQIATCDPLEDVDLLQAVAHQALLATLIDAVRSRRSVYEQEVEAKPLPTAVFEAWTSEERA